MDQAALLINGYCDNDLSDEEGQCLVAWLREDPARVDRLAREFQLHSLLYDLLKEQQLQSSAWSYALEETTNPSGRNATSQSLSTTPTAVRRRMLFVAAIAASLTFATILLLKPDAPTVVAQVSSINGDAVTSDGTMVLAGAMMPEGETLRVDRGDLVVTFACGAKVRVDAPAVFVVDGSSAGTLACGSASARVPTQAIGFAIHSPLADFIDLGTEFRVQVLDKDRLQLHVFDGLVEVRLDKRFRDAHDGPLKFSEGRSARFDLAANAIVNLQYDESLREEFESR